MVWSELLLFRGADGTRGETTLSRCVVVPELRGDSELGSEGQSHPQITFQTRALLAQEEEGKESSSHGQVQRRWIRAPVSKESPWPGALPRSLGCSLLFQFNS